MPGNCGVGCTWRAMMVLRTERLVLRWFAADDAAFILELVNDPDWLKNIGDRGLRTVDEARAWIESRLVASYLEHGYGLWAMQRREDGALVGMCGLVRRPSLPLLDVGFALVPRARRQGYVREAAAACVAYAFRVLEEPRVLAITSPSNLASIRVLESIGLRHERTEVLADDTRESAVYGSNANAGVEGHAPLSGDADRDAIARVARRFFCAFDNRGDTIATVAALPALFLRDAIVTTVGAAGTETSRLHDFITPRATLLTSRRVREFSEAETEARTDLVGSVAQRWCRYEKSGVFDGKPFRGGGVKTMQLVKMAGRWKIAALAWEDQPENR